MWCGACVCMWCVCVVYVNARGSGEFFTSFPVHCALTEQNSEVVPVTEHFGD